MVYPNVHFLGKLCTWDFYIKVFLVCGVFSLLVHVLQKVQFVEFIRKYFLHRCSLFTGGEGKGTIKSQGKLGCWQKRRLKKTGGSGKTLQEWVGKLRRGG